MVRPPVPHLRLYPTRQIRPHLFIHTFDTRLNFQCCLARVVFHYNRATNSAGPTLRQIGNKAQNQPQGSPSRKPNGQLNLTSSQDPLYLRRNSHSVYRSGHRGLAVGKLRLIPYEPTSCAGPSASHSTTHSLHKHSHKTANASCRKSAIAFAQRNPVAHACDESEGRAGPLQSCLNGPH